MLQRKPPSLLVRRLGESLVCLALSFGASACGGSQPPPSSTPEASPSAPSGDTSTSPVDATSAHGASIFVVHLISDFATFKKYFDDGAAERAKIGVKGHLLTRLDGDRVVIHFVADNVGQAEDALRSPSIQKFFERAGAPDSSLIWVTKNIVLDMPKTPPSGETFSLFLRVKVADFAALKSDFEQRRSVFAEQGVIGEGLHQSTAQDNVAILHFVGTAKDKLEALPKRAEFIELLKHAGVKDEVKPLVGVDVERSRQN